MNRIFTIMSGLLLILACHETGATTLGEIELLSAVGEPFSATIEVHMSGTDSVDEMIASIASAETHTAFGITYEDYSSTITVEVVQRNDKVLLILSSRKDLHEVYLEFIFQLRFIAGSIYRAYSVLPEFNIPQMAGAQNKTQRAGNTKRKIPAGSYTVQSQDTLWKIATSMDRKLGSITQRIRLLEAANPNLKIDEIHAGDSIIIPANRAPVNKLARSQKRDTTDSPASKKVTQPVNETTSERRTKPGPGSLNPMLASEKELAALARRAAGYRIVRLTALSGPQFSQSQSGVVTSSQTNNDTMALELEEIRTNLESLAQENLTLSNDIRRLEAQNQQLREPPQVDQAAIQLQDTSTSPERQPNTTPPIQSPISKVNIDKSEAQKSEGISTILIFSLVVILLILVGIAIWAKRRYEEREQRSRERFIEASSVANSAENLSASTTKEGGEDSETVDESSSENPDDNDSSEYSESAESYERMETSEETDFTAPDASSETDSLNFDDAPKVVEPMKSNLNSNKSPTKDLPINPTSELSPTRANFGVDNPFAPQKNHKTQESIDFPSPGTASQNTPADFKPRDSSDSDVPISAFPTTDSIDFESQDSSAQSSGQPANFMTADTADPDEPISIFPSKDTIDFVSFDASAEESESNQTELAVPDAPLVFDNFEVIEEIEEDQSDTSDLSFEFELDTEIESAVMSAEELVVHDEAVTKSMGDVFEDLHLPGSDHETTTSDPIHVPQKPASGDTGSASYAERWNDLQKEWDDAIASGIENAESLAVVYIELDDMVNIEDQQGPMRTEGLITVARNLLAESIQPQGKTLHRIKDHTFLFLYHYKTETELRERGNLLVRVIQDHDFVILHEHLTLSLSVGMVPFTTLFKTLDDYLRCGKMTIAELRTELAKARISGGVAIHFEDSNKGGDWENEEVFLSKVKELLESNMFEVEYQTLINLSGNHQQVYMCKTELGPEVDKQTLPPNFLRKAFTCSVTPEIERQSMMTFMDKIRSLEDKSVKMLFRVDIRSATDPQFTGWLFQQLEAREIDPSSITLFVYAGDVVSYKPNILNFAAKLRQQGSRLGMLNVDYDEKHLQAALDVGASIVRINPSIVDNVVESSVRFGTRPVSSGTRETSKFKDYLSSFQKRNIETILFSTYVEAIPGLIVLNANNLRASYIQTPMGMIEDDQF